MCTPTQKNAHTHAHGHPRHAQKAFSPQLIADLHSPVIKLFTALWPPHHTHMHSCTHTQSLLSECVRAGLLQLSGGRLGWGLKRLWNLPQGTSTQSGHVSFFLLCYHVQTLSADFQTCLSLSVVWRYCSVMCGVLDSNTLKLRSRPCRSTDSTCFV